jgi:N-methylhydantoinase A
MARIGVDVGGTFTDIIVQKSDNLESFKVPSTPSNPEQGVINGFEAFVEGTVPDQLQFLGHGTTVATNALLEGELATVALVTTEGFRDVIEIGRQDRPALYDINFERSEETVPRDLRFTIDERISAEGERLTAPTSEEIEQLGARIPDAVEIVAISTLFSFLDDEHERAIRSGLEANGVEDVVISSEVLPEFREYERTSTTVVNAALKPVVKRYLQRLGEGTAELGYDKEWTIMQSNGGLMSVEKAKEQPVRTVVSGPAAGVKGAQFLASQSGYEDLITLDMGGTSTDVCLVDDGKPASTTDREVAGKPVRVPSIDIHTIGAGGGSIAWVDDAGALRIGPESAGADPGPVCYDRGGTQPTVTDAQAVLGRIDPENTLASDLTVDVEAARTAIERELGSLLDRSVTEIARGILEITNASMQRALRVVSVERGYDPREFALVAYGGAGPLHAPELARTLSIPTVLVPKTAGVLSSLGLLSSQLKYFEVESVLRPVSELSSDEIDEILSTAVHSLGGELVDEGIPRESMWFDSSVELRYRGQSFTLSIELPENEFREEHWTPVLSRFHDKHEDRYGYASPGDDVELVNVRVNGIGKTESVELPAVSSGDVSRALLDERDVWIDGEYRETAIYSHEDLPAGGTFDGPAIIQSTESTTLLLSDQSASVDEQGTIIIDTRRK